MKLREAPSGQPFEGTVGQILVCLGGDEWEVTDAPSPGGSVPPLTRCYWCNPAYAFDDYDGSIAKPFNDLGTAYQAAKDAGWTSVTMLLCPGNYNAVDFDTLDDVCINVSLVGLGNNQQVVIDNINWQATTHFTSKLQLQNLTITNDLSKAGLGNAQLFMSDVDIVNTPGAFIQFSAIRPQCVELLLVPIPALAPGELGYVDVSVASTRLRGITQGQPLGVNPNFDLEAEGVGAGYFVNARVSATNTIRFTFVGSIAETEKTFIVWLPS